MSPEDQQYLPKETQLLTTFTHREDYKETRSTENHSDYTDRDRLTRSDSNTDKDYKTTTSITTGGKDNAGSSEEEWTCPAV